MLCWKEGGTVKGRYSVGKRGHRGIEGEMSSAGEEGREERRKELARKGQQRKD